MCFPFLCVVDLRWLDGSCCWGRLNAESDRRENAERYEGDRHHDLRELEWRVVLSGSDCFQRLDLQERLHDQDEHIQIQSEHRADHIRFAPRANEVTRVPG